MLATDFIQTHAFYIYSTSSVRGEATPPVVVGYDAKDFQNYFNFIRSPQELFMLHNVIGNTGRNGEWYYNFTLPPGEITADLKCLLWVRAQIEQPLDISSLRVQYCPCTKQQALLDWSFWFGNTWGLSSSPNCATALFSGSQHTLECCYDRSGNLLVGPIEGGSYKKYNPLFYYENYLQDDLMPYIDCCVSSSRCDLYYKYRPSDDCSKYIPFIPSKYDKSYVLLTYTSSISVVVARI